MKQIKYVNGPYTDPKNNRVFVVLTYEDGTQKTTSNAKFIVEQALNRELTKEETVDHIDGDFTNDEVSNLQLLTGADNSRKSAPPAQYYEFDCPFCGNRSVKSWRDVKGNWKQGKTSGPYCSRSCAGKAQFNGNNFENKVGKVFSVKCYDSKPKSIVDVFGVQKGFKPFYQRASKEIPLKSNQRKSQDTKNKVLCIYCGDPCHQNVYWHADCLTCIDCNEKVTTLRCRRHASRLQETKIIWPSNDELIERLKTSNYTKLGKELGVSDNAIRKRLNRG